MRSPITIGAGLAAALALGACQDQPTAPRARAIAPDAPARSVGASAPSPSVASATFGRANTADVMRPAINPGDYVCSDRSPVMSWWLGTAIDFIRREPAIFSVVYTELY